MFRGEFFCDDKQVVGLHYLLQGRVYDLKLIPVVNATKQNGKLVATTDGNLISMFSEYLKKHKIAGEVSADTMREFLTSVGKSESSRGYLVVKAVEVGVLKKTGKGRATRYLVK